MKNSFIKKTFAFLIAAVLLLMSFSTGSVAATGNTNNYPTIFIRGQGIEITDNGTTKGKTLYPVRLPDGYLTEQGKKLLSPLTDGLLLDKWDGYNEGLYDAAAPYLLPMALNKNGEVTDRSGIIIEQSYFPRKNDGKYHYSYVWFSYDWRLDPVEIADQLHNFIITIKKNAETDKVNLIGRCLGGDVVLAYIAKYDVSDINDCIFLSTAFDGFDTIGAIFAGKVNVDKSTLDRFVNLYLATEDYANDPTFETIREVVTVLSLTSSLEFSADLVNKLFNGIKDGAYKRLFRESLATMPSFWAYIGDEYYEDAKKFIFEGYEDEYKVLIDKIDNFHYNILNKYGDILDKADAAGIKVYNISKYGFQCLPVLGANKEMSDLIMSTSSSSIGATCADIDSVLSEEYIASRDAKYISPDKQIDASTCRYPEHTWFIKNMSHRNMPDCLEDLIGAIVTFDGYTTVDDIKDAYPQFLMSSDDGTEIFPATAENSDLTDRTNPNPIKALLKLIRKLFEMIKDYFKNVFNK